MENSLWYSAQAAITPTLHKKNGKKFEDSYEP
jgi:hypothetical protein